MKLHEERSQLEVGNMTWHRWQAPCTTRWQGPDRQLWVPCKLKLAQCLGVHRQTNRQTQKNTNETRDQSCPLPLLMQTWSQIALATRSMKANQLQQHICRTQTVCYVWENPGETRISEHTITNMQLPLASSPGQTKRGFHKSLTNSTGRINVRLRQRKLNDSNPE